LNLGIIDIKAQENLNGALKLAEELNDTKSQIDVIHRQGLVHLDSGSLEKAKKAADKIKSLVEKGLYMKQIRYFDHLMGEMELKRENFSQSVEHFESALSLAPYDPLNKYAIFMNSLAFAYYRKGDFEKAQEEYEKITLSTYGRRSYGDIYAKSFYMLGKIYEQQGNTVKAIGHHERFLDLWKEADSGIAEVEGARKRLGKLREQMKGDLESRG
jgi:tetratricopeptide (TPR) repeat protein